MSNPNKSYFDKYTLPVVRDIDKVNIYEFENGMDYEMTTSGKTINIDTIKEAQSKVLKNLKKDPNYYTNMLVNETIKMVGEYGSEISGGGIYVGGGEESDPFSILYQGG